MDHILLNRWIALLTCLGLFLLSYGATPQILSAFDGVAVESKSFSADYASELAYKADRKTTPLSKVGFVTRSVAVNGDEYVEKSADEYFTSNGSVEKGGKYAGGVVLSDGALSGSGEFLVRLRAYLPPGATLERVKVQWYGENTGTGSGPDHVIRNVNTNEVEYADDEYESEGWHDWDNIDINKYVSVNGSEYTVDYGVWTSAAERAEVQKVGAFFYYSLEPADLSINGFTTNWTVSTAGGSNSGQVCNNGGETLYWGIQGGTQSWWSVSPSSGSLGFGECETVTVSVEATGSTSSRSDNVIFANTNDLNDNAGFSFQQEGLADLAVDGFTLLSSTVEPEGTAEGSRVRNIGDADLDWRTDVSDSWITVSPSYGNNLSGGTSESVQITVDRNTTTSARSGSVRFYNAVDSGDDVTVAIEQAGNPNPADLDISGFPSTWDVAQSGDEDAGYVINRGDETLYWGVSKPSEADWVTLSYESGPIAGGDSRAFTISVSANETTASRSARIRFFNTQDAGDDVEVVIDQASGNQPPVADASDISGQPEDLYPNGLYTVTTRCADPNGRENLNFCRLRLLHPTGNDLTLEWDQDTGNRYAWGEDGSSNYIKLVELSSSPIPNGYDLTWSFALEPTWESAGQGIRLGVQAVDDSGAQSVWDYDASSISFKNPTGITILVHGLNLSGDESGFVQYPFSNNFNPVDDYWGVEKVLALLEAYGGGEVHSYDPPTGTWVREYRDTWGSLDDGESGETILVFDWARVSNDGTVGQAEAAADALFAALIDSDGDGQRDEGYTSQPLHFIGHSRGTVVVSETVQRLGIHGKQVGYVTNLDVHDFDESSENGVYVPFDGYFHDPSVQVWKNTKYADNFWQKSNIAPIPSGRALDALPERLPYENNLTNLNGFYDNTCRFVCLNDYGKHSHSLVIDWYFGTVDQSSVLEEWQANWYEGSNKYETGFALWRKQGGHKLSYAEESIGNFNSQADPVSLQGLEPYDGGAASYFAGEDSSPTDFFMGDFDMPDIRDPEVAGWSHHGGNTKEAAIQGRLELHPVIRNEYGDIRRLRQTSVKHNRIYISETAEKLWFTYEVINNSLGQAGDTDKIQVLLGDGTIILDNVWLGQGEPVGGRLPAHIEEHRGAVTTIEFRIKPREGYPVTAHIALDNIEIEKTSAVTTKPAIPIAFLPEDDAVTTSLTPTFEWSAFVDGGDGDTQAGYQLRVRDDEVGDAIVYDTGFIEDASATSHVYTPGAYSGTDPVTGQDRVSQPLEHGKQYHWHVRYRDSGGDWSGWSADDPNPQQDFFTPARPGDVTLTVLSPDGQEVWKTGSLQRVEWTSQNLTGTIELDLYRDGNLESEIISGAENIGSYDWLVPSDLPNDPGYTVRVASTEDGTIYDESDGPFTIYTDDASDQTPPAPPAGLEAVASSGQIDLSWDPGDEADLAGYNLYRSTASFSDPNNATKLNASFITGTAYTDEDVASGTTYYYRVTAVDGEGNESGLSREVNATPSSDPGTGVTREVLANLPQPMLFSLSSYSTVDGKLYVFGGFEPGTNPYQAYDTVWSFDLASETWSDLGITLPYGIFDYHTTGVFHGDHFYLPPGFASGNTNGWGSHNQIIDIDLASGSASETVAFSSSSRIWNIASVKAGSKIYYLGGHTGSDMNEIFEFDPEGQTLTQVATMSFRANGLSATYGADGWIYYWAPGDSRKVERFNPDTYAVETMSAELPSDLSRWTNLWHIAGERALYFFGAQVDPAVYKYDYANDVVSETGWTVPGDYRGRVAAVQDATQPHVIYAFERNGAPESNPLVLTKLSLEANASQIATIRGQAIDEDGAIVEGMRVQATRMDGSGTTYTTTTDASGNYSLEVSPGTYRVLGQAVMGAKYVSNDSKVQEISVAGGQTITRNLDGATGYFLELSNIEISGAAPPLTVDPGTDVQVSFDYTTWSRDGCPGCIVYIAAGIGSDGQDAQSVGIPGGNPGESGRATLTLTVPSAPGTYDVFALVAPDVSETNALDRYERQYPDEYTYVPVGQINAGSVAPVEYVLEEDFEEGVLNASVAVDTRGSFSSSPGIKDVSDLRGAKAFGFGRSTCGANCFDDYETALTITLSEPTFLHSVSFKAMELYGDWGSSGHIFVDGERLEKAYFGRQPSNSRTPDSEYESHYLAIDKTVRTVEFRVTDITNESEIFIDDIVLSPEGRRAADVARSVTGPVFEDLDMDLEFTGGSSTDGTLTVSRYDEAAPNNESIEGSATSGNGSTIVPDIASPKRYYSVQNSGLSAFEYQVCLDLGGLPGIDDPGQLVILKRDNSEEAWTPYDTVLDGDQICSSGLSSFSEFTVGGESALNPLPVELVDFTASADERNVVLQWRTESEKQNAGFDVERRVGSDSFEKLTFIDGAGTINEPQTYRFDDVTVPFDTDVVTYRLKQIDLDGAHEYSEEVEINLDVPLQLQLYKTFPNPATSRATLRYQLPHSGLVRISLYNTLGQRVLDPVNRVMSAGRHQQTLQLNQLGSGLYFIRIETESESITRKLVVVR